MVPAYKDVVDSFYTAVFCRRFKPFLAVCVALAAFTGLGQTPPPNDNFSNSITLTGTDIIFSGSLADSTLEDSQELQAYENYGITTNAGSIWWNWTAPTNTTLTLQILNPGIYVYPSFLLNVLAVYTATNGSTTPAGLVLPALGILPSYGQMAPLSISIPVLAGTNYQIQLIGDNPASVSIWLIATNTPVIITQPRSQTVYSNASATFYVVYAGTNQSAFTFQWSLNGTNLPGETAPMLALTNIDSTMAGVYTVAVGNSAGVTISQQATLTVSQSTVPISLSAISDASNAFTFSVAGELGRTYRLKSSTNLVDWISATDFPELATVISDATSLFFETNTSQVLTVTNSASSAFFRVMPYIIGDPNAEICINNLRQIRIAKILWARDWANSNNAYLNSFTIPEFYTGNDAVLAPYFPHGSLPFCPEDPNQHYSTSYLFDNLQTDPACLINPSNHVLEDPQ
jgi:hypothetical protein